MVIVIRDLLDGIHIEDGTKSAFESVCSDLAEGLHKTRYRIQERSNV